MIKDNIITAIPFVDNIYCKAVLGTMVIHKQIRSDHSDIREININYNRNDLQNLIKASYSDKELVLLMDSDVIATQDQLNKLINSFNGDPLALKTKSFDTCDHICCACCILTMQDYLNIDYINTYIEWCQCKKIMSKFKVSYLEGEQAYEYKETSIYTNVFHNSIIEPHLDQMQLN